jgi:hypothetical protein
MNWNNTTLFIVGLAIGAGSVFLLSLSQSVGTLSPITKYFQSIPSIDTSTPLKG